MIFLKALVTGASGFVGLRLIEKLSDQNIDVLGISRTKSYENLRETGKWKCDILDQAALTNIVSDYRPDYLFHLAAPAYIPDSYNNPRETYNIIFNGTQNLLEIAKGYVPNVRMLYVSSADVYGQNLNNRIKETDPYDPINPYSAAKSCSELLCLQYHQSFETQVVIARPFNHTGPGQSKEFVCSNFALQVAKIANDSGSNKTLYTGNIEVERDFLDIRDVVDAYHRLIDKGSVGEIYNVCSGRATSIQEIISTLFEIAGINDYVIKSDPLKVRKSEISKRVGDNSKLIECTEWKQKYELKQTLAQLLYFWRRKI
ncbi:GDP-mannose 4,6-dehydratase [Paenibacillus thiaminolyticus]|uniref:GDP-mannose 4,6-dehydratase n=1 Tax=Paenibacillus thiaminolyticus TaxID=49283 RepID=UPI003D284812